MLSSGATGSHRWLLRVDGCHPVFFDHPVDHVPGMLLVEAARQAAVAATGGRGVPIEMDTEFRKYVEFAEPCWIDADLGPLDRISGTRTVVVIARQRDADVFAAVVRIQEVR